MQAFWITYCRAFVVSNPLAQFRSVSQWTGGLCRGFLSSLIPQGSLGQLEAALFGIARMSRRQNC